MYYNLFLVDFEINSTAEHKRLKKKKQLRLLKEKEVGGKGIQNFRIIRCKVTKD